MTMPLMQLLKGKIGQADMDTDMKLLMWTVSSLAFYFRIHELLSNSEATFDPDQTLLVEDFQLRGQEGNRVLEIRLKCPKEKKAGKTNMPGHVRASINWNTLKRMYQDKYSMGITDGAKVIVCKLKQNPMGFTSVAYPVDELRLPQWFKDLAFDHAEMEQTIIDNKLDNLIGVLKWDVRSTEEKNTFNSLFEF